MNHDQALDVVRTVLGEIAPELDVETIDLQADLRGELDLDSMDFLNLVVGVHESTGVDIPERDYPKIATLDSFADYLAAAHV
jgi:acyl carrier protein